MKSFFTDIYRKNRWLLLEAIGLFLCGYFLNLYFDSDASVSHLSNSIQSSIQEREQDFEHLTRDTAFLRRLAERRYTEEELMPLVDRKYGIFLYAKDSAVTPGGLQFWNDQRSLPTTAILNMADGYIFTQLDNGKYNVIKKTVRLANDKVMVAVALIPVRWQYFIATTNLTPEFTENDAAEVRVAISATPTEFPVRTSLGNGAILFYLAKKPGYHAPAHNWSIPLVILLGVLLVLVILHNIAHTIRERWGAVLGISFLVVVILLLRIMIYVYPGILNLRQFELFDPTIYSSSIVLSSLGDLVINSFLFCWIILFIKREISEYTIPQSVHRWRNWIWTFVGLVLLVVTTFVFANIVQSLVTDAKISFNVTNFFSLLNNYSFVGFVALAALALGYFFLSQVLFQLVGYLIRALSIVLYIIIAFMGLLWLTLIHNNTGTMELDILVLLWLLAYTWLMQRRIFSDLRFRLNVSEVLFWLFIFSTSISAVILFENRKAEEGNRRRKAEQLSMQADPTSEKMLSIDFRYIDNDYLSYIFPRFKDPVLNLQMKDSMVNRTFGYQNNFDTHIYTYDETEKPLFNDRSHSYDTLNTIFTTPQSKNTNIPDLKYYEKSFDKYTYIYRKVVRSDTGSKPAGYLFILSEPKSYKGNNALVPELFRQKRDDLPEHYAIYSKRELISDNNDYPFSTHLTDAQIPKTDFAHVRKGAYDELWHRISDDNYVVVVKRDNSALEDITLFAYLFSAFLFLVALFRAAAPFDLEPPALEPAEELLAAEYPQPDPYDHHLHQPVLLHRHRGGHDRILQ